VPLTSSRGGALFCAHPYPTKIDPVAIALLIACHTKPGDVVFDGFGGSGTTAIGALLCSNPPDELRSKAKSLGLAPRWGSRNVVVYELSGLGAFIGRTLTLRIDPDLFRRRAEAILRQAETRYGWIYQAEDDQGRVGEVRHIIWTDVLVCGHCGSDNTFWEGCVSLEPANIGSQFTCRKCHKQQDVDAAARRKTTTLDDVLAQEVTTRLRRVARVYGVTGRRTWARSPVASDLKLLKRIQEELVPRAFPVAAMRWGDLYRAGYHEGITHVHQFYTRRNLIAMAALNELVGQEVGPIRQALEFWLSSYNASHSTIMTRVVAKKNTDDLVVTSNQPGVLYVSALPVEKNVFRGLRRKLTTISQAFAEVQALEGDVRVVQGSSIATDLPDGSVDYVFTDPPFGGNIPYSEANYISEAWLGKLTETSDEAIVSPAQGKDVGGYQALLTKCFSEFRRILKPSGLATVAFHSTQASVWQALVNTFKASGFAVSEASILDKRQGSFKQVTTANHAKGDALLLLRPAPTTRPQALDSCASVIHDLVFHAVRSTNNDERSPQRLYSRFIARYMVGHAAPPLDAEQFYRLLEARFMRNGNLCIPE